MRYVSLQVHQRAAEERVPEGVALRRSTRIGQCQPSHVRIPQLDMNSEQMLSVAAAFEGVPEIFWTEEDRVSWIECQFLTVVLSLSAGIASRHSSAQYLYHKNLMENQDKR